MKFITYGETTFNVDRIDVIYIEEKTLTIKVNGVNLYYDHESPEEAKLVLDKFIKFLGSCDV